MDSAVKFEEVPSDHALPIAGVDILYGHEFVGYTDDDDEPGLRVCTALRCERFCAAMSIGRCIHVFGLFTQHRAALALMKSADRGPNQVNALEALCSPGLVRSPV